jgi:hypothetical protein
LAGSFANGHTHYYGRALFSGFTCLIWLLTGLHPVSQTPGLGVMMGLEVGHGTAEVYAGVQA